MQQRLYDLGYLKTKPDGNFGAATEQALIAFQKKNKLNADGIAGASTLTLLNSKTTSASVTPTAAPTTLKRGDSGADVKLLQQRLRELGYITFAADGQFGSGTQNAIIAFQKANGLKADGVAGASTQTKLYSSTAKAATTPATVGKTTNTGIPSASSVRLLHFFNDVKPKYTTGTTVTVYDPASKITWKLRFLSLGRHADAEPLTKEDTVNMNKAFGTTTWTPKAVWVKFPDGVWSMGTMHNTPHLTGTIKDNGFNGHLCMHFLRDMSEVTKNDPNYGVQNQRALRAAWKALTGQTIN